MQLTDGHKTLLEHIQKHDTPTTPELAQNEQVANHYKKSSLRSVLNRLEEEGYVDAEDGRPKSYQLTEDGYTVVKKMREKRKRRMENAVQHQDGGFSMQDASDRFYEYFHNNEVDADLMQAVADGEDRFAIDYTRLERCDTELADAVLRRPDDMLTAANHAVSKIDEDLTALSFSFSNIPDYHAKKIRELNADDIGRLVTVPGIVLKASMTKPMLVEASFECVSCGNVATVEQDTGKLKSPYKCSDCGGKKFEAVDRCFDSVRFLKLQEKPDSPDKKTIKVRVHGSMADDEIIHSIKPGTPVKLTGVVEAEKKGKKSDNDYRLYIAALDVEEEQNKWDEIELSERDRERNRNILEYGPVEAFRDSIAADKVAHRGLMKEALLLFFLGKTETNGNLHVLVMGEPGTGKSEANSWVEQYFPRTVKAVATTATGVGLTATVKEDKDFGGYVAEGGSLTMADGGYHITDEFDKINDGDVPKFNEALSEGRITLNKGDVIDLKLDADVSEWTTANPLQYDYFDPSEEKYKQIPVPQDSTKDRFDVIIGLEEYDTGSGEKEDVINHIMRRGEDGYEVTEPAFEPDALVKFVTEASRINPTMSDAAIDRIIEAWFAVKEMEAFDERLITNRSASALRKLAIAYARAHLSDTVEEEHADMAIDFYRRCLASIDFEVGRDDFGSMATREMSELERVKEAVERVCADADNDLAAVDEICEKVDLSNDRVEELLKEKDDFYSPKQGRWRNV